MKIAIGIVICFAFLLDAAIAAPAADTGKKNAGSATQITIPKDAVPNGDGRSYSYTDKEGKKWIYTRTAIGVLKRAAPDQPSAAKGDTTAKSDGGSAKTAATASTSKNDGGIRAIDKGDTVRFERQSPFGVMSWEKKKSELTDKERQILESQNAKPEQTKTEQK